MSERVGTSGTAFWRDADDAEVLRRYRTLVNAVDDGIYQLDADGRFVAVNDGIAELTGYDREDLLGEHLSLLLDDGSTAERLPPNHTDQSERVEFTVQTADGGRVRCEVGVTPFEADGAVAGTIGIVHDVIDRERPDQRCGDADQQDNGEATNEVERELRETKTRLDVAASVGSVGTWTWEVREDVVTADERLAE
jgi:PAS domain S-box-containing protein